MPDYEIFDDVNSVIEIGIDFFLSKPHPVGAVRVASHIMAVLDTVVLIELVSIFIDIVQTAIGCIERLKDQSYYLVRFN